MGVPAHARTSPPPPPSPAPRARLMRALVERAGEELERRQEATNREAAMREQLAKQLLELQSKVMGASQVRLPRVLVSRCSRDACGVTRFVL